MNFREQLEADLDNVFFNTEEFAEVHNVNGKDITIIIDHKRLKERNMKEFNGQSTGELLYFIKKSDFLKMPEQDEIQIFDDEQYMIFDVKSDGLTYEIILTRNLGG